MTDLFEDELSAAQAELSMASEEKKAVAITVRKNKTIMRRANSETHLEEIMPTVEMGNSYHIISRGDVDSMTYLVHLLKNGGPIETLTLSTWRMAMPDINEINLALESGMIGQCHLCLGEIFPNQYPDEYLRVREIEATGRLRVTVARNHSKIMLGANKTTGWHFVIESSANANTNPRIEQTAIHMSRDLHDFYSEFFSDLKDIDKKAKIATAPVDAKQ